MYRLAITSMLLGLLTTVSPCILPLYPGFPAYLSGQNEGTSIFWVGLGPGIPLLILSFFSVVLQKRLHLLFAHHGRKLKRIGGVLLMGVALCDLTRNWDLLQLFLFVDKVN